MSSYFWPKRRHFEHHHHAKVFIAFILCHMYSKPHTKLFKRWRTWWELVHDNFIKEIDWNIKDSYSVGLTWKNGKREILSNRHMSGQRVINSTKKLKSLKKFE